MTTINEQRATIDATLAQIPNELSREQYEMLAERFGFEPRPDVTLSVNGEFELPEYSVEHIIRANINIRRAWAVRAEREKLAAVSHRQSIRQSIRQSLSCRRCGQPGYAGEYPFSTNPASGLCDDCL